MRSKQRPRAARAEATRVDRWWPWLDSNGVTLFVPQYDRGTCCELPLAVNTWYRYKYLIRATCGLRIVRKKSNDCFYIDSRPRFYTRTRKFKHEVTNRRGKKGPFLNLKKCRTINGLSINSGELYLVHGIVIPGTRYIGGTAVLHVCMFLPVTHVVAVCIVTLVLLRSPT